MLREPVERTLSHLRHHRKMNAEARDLPLETIYEDVFRPAFFANHMVKMFSLTAEEIATSAARDTWAMVMRIDFTPDRLARAKEHVGRSTCSGLHDPFDDFCAELQSRFGWQLGEPLYANRTPAEAVPASLRARIASDNAIDLELYEHACAYTATPPAQAGSARVGMHRAGPSRPAEAGGADANGSTARRHDLEGVRRATELSSPIPNGTGADRAEVTARRG